MDVYLWVFTSCSVLGIWRALSVNCCCKQSAKTSALSLSSTTSVVPVFSGGIFLVGLFFRSILVVFQIFCSSWLCFSILSCRLSFRCCFSYSCTSAVTLFNSIFICGSSVKNNASLSCSSLDWVFYMSGYVVRMCSDFCDGCGFCECILQALFQFIHQFFDVLFAVYY